MAQSAPTKGNLIAARHSRELALTGFDLMDKKRNILIRELMAMTSRAKEIRGPIDTIFAAAYDSLTTAEIALTASTEAIVSVQIDDSLSMRYRLLKADALNKTDAPLPSDTLIKEVVEYYDRHGNANERMRAHYLLGCAYRDMGEAPAALH